MVVRGGSAVVGQLVEVGQALDRVGAPADSA
jgi:hypothetical protein